MHQCSLSILASHINPFYRLQLYIQNIQALCQSLTTLLNGYNLNHYLQGSSMPSSMNKNHKRETNPLQIVQDQLTQSIDNKFIGFLDFCSQSTATREEILAQFKSFSSAINSATLLPDSDSFSQQEVTRIEQVAQYSPFYLNDCFHLVYGLPLCEKQKQLHTAIYNGYSRRHQHLLRKFGKQNPRAQQESLDRLGYLESIGTGPLMYPLITRDFILPSYSQSGLSKVIRISLDSLIEENSLVLTSDEYRIQLSCIQYLLDFADSKKIQSQNLHEFIQLSGHSKHSFFSLVESNLSSNDINVIRNMHDFLTLICDNYPFYNQQIKTEPKIAANFSRVITKLGACLRDCEKKLASLDKGVELFLQPTLQMHNTSSQNSGSDVFPSFACEDTFFSKSDCTAPLSSRGSSALSSMDFTEGFPFQSGNLNFFDSCSQELRY